MKSLLKQTKTASEVKRVQCILLGSLGMISDDVAPIVGFTATYVRTVWRSYRIKGDSALLGENRGACRGRAHFTLDDEAAFLKPFFAQAIAGKILIVSEIQDAYEKLIGMEVHHSIVYNLLDRHNWRKIVPRPAHPKTDFDEQEAFKDAIFPPGDR